MQSDGTKTAQQIVNKTQEFRKLSGRVLRASSLRQIQAGLARSEPDNAGGAVCQARAGRGDSAGRDSTTNVLRNNASPHQSPHWEFEPCRLQAKEESVSGVLAAFACCFGPGFFWTS